MIVETQDTMRFKRNKIEEGWEALPAGKVFSRAYVAPMRQQPVTTPPPEAVVSAASTESVEILSQPVAFQRPSVETASTTNSPHKSPRTSESGSFRARFRSLLKGSFRDRSPQMSPTRAKKEEAESKKEGHGGRLRRVFKQGIDMMMHKQPAIPRFERGVSQVRQLVKHSQRCSDNSSTSNRS